MSDSPDTLPVVPPPAGVVYHLLVDHDITPNRIRREPDAQHDRLHASGQADHVHGRSES